MAPLEVCRACLSSKIEDGLIDWQLPSEHNDLTYAQCFHECTQLPVEVASNDVAVVDVSYLCLKCVRELESHYRFLLKCRESHNVLTSQARPADKAIRTPAILGDEEEETICSEFEGEILFTQELACVQENEAEPPLTGEKRPKKGTIHSCHLCPRTFKRPIYLRQHLASHLGTRSRNFPCDQCDKKFFTKNALVGHALLHNADHVPQYTCDQCGKSYRTKGNLTVHQRLHASSRDFVCTVCDKGYVRRVDLSLHVKRTHSGETYKCTLCDKQYVQETSYNDHMRAHEGRYYKCVICEGVYTSRQSYFDHSLTHAQQPLKCALCEKEFVRRNRLRHHIRTKHGLDDVEAIEKHIVECPKERRERGCAIEVVQC